MIVKLNGEELIKWINSKPEVFKDVTVSRKYDIGFTEYWGYDYEEVNGEMPCADVFIKNFFLKSFDFPEAK